MRTELGRVGTEISMYGARCDGNSRHLRLHCVRKTRFIAAIAVLLVGLLGGLAGLASAATHPVPTGTPVAFIELRGHSCPDDFTGTGFFQFLDAVHE